MCDMLISPIVSTTVNLSIGLWDLEKVNQPKWIKRHLKLHLRYESTRVESYNAATLFWQEN